MEERFPKLRKWLDPARKLLRELMDERGVTITRLCVVLGWSRTYFHDIFRRDMDLKMVHILAVLDELDVPPSSFFVELTRRYEAIEGRERGDGDSEDDLGKQSGQSG